MFTQSTIMIYSVRILFSIHLQRESLCVSIFLLSRKRQGEARIHAVCELYDAQQCLVLCFVCDATVTTDTLHSRCLLDGYTLVYVNVDNGETLWNISNCMIRRIRCCVFYCLPGLPGWYGMVVALVLLEMRLATFSGLFDLQHIGV